MPRGGRRGGPTDRPTSEIAARAGFKRQVLHKLLAAAEKVDTANRVGFMATFLGGEPFLNHLVLCTYRHNAKINSVWLNLLAEIQPHSVVSI